MACGFAMQRFAIHGKAGFHNHENLFYDSLTVSPVTNDTPIPPQLRIFAVPLTTRIGYNLIE